MSFKRAVTTWAPLAGLDIPLTYGSLLLMGDTMQEHYEHHIPKTARAIGPRINLTFRISESYKPENSKHG